MNTLAAILLLALAQSTPQVSASSWHNATIPSGHSTARGDMDGYWHDGDIAGGVWFEQTGRYMEGVVNTHYDDGTALWITFTLWLHGDSLVSGEAIVSTVIGGIEYLAPAGRITIDPKPGNVRMIWRLTGPNGRQNMRVWELERWGSQR